MPRTKRSEREKRKTKIHDYVRKAIQKIRELEFASIMKIDENSRELLIEQIYEHIHKWLDKHIEKEKERIVKEMVAKRAKVKRQKKPRKK